MRLAIQALPADELNRLEPEFNCPDPRGFLRAFTGEE